MIGTSFFDESESSTVQELLLFDESAAGGGRGAGAAAAEANVMLMMDGAPVPSGAADHAAFVSWCGTVQVVAWMEARVIKLCLLPHAAASTSAFQPRLVRVPCNNFPVAGFFATQVHSTETPSTSTSSAAPSPPPIELAVVCCSLDGRVFFSRLQVQVDSERRAFSVQARRFRERAVVYDPLREGRVTAFGLCSNPRASPQDLSITVAVSTGAVFVVKLEDHGIEHRVEFFIDGPLALAQEQHQPQQQQQHQSRSPSAAGGDGADGGGAAAAGGGGGGGGVSGIVDKVASWIFGGGGGNGDGSSAQQNGDGESNQQQRGGGVASRNATMQHVFVTSFCFCARTSRLFMCCTDGSLYALQQGAANPQLVPIPAYLACRQILPATPSSQQHQRDGDEEDPSAIFVVCDDRNFPSRWLVTLNTADMIIEQNWCAPAASSNSFCVRAELARGPGLDLPFAVWQVPDSQTSVLWSPDFGVAAVSAQVLGFFLSPSSSAAAPGGEEGGEELLGIVVPGASLAVVRPPSQMSAIEYAVTRLAVAARLALPEHSAMLLPTSGTCAGAAGDGGGRRHLSLLVHPIGESDAMAVVPEGGSLAAFVSSHHHRRGHHRHQQQQQHLERAASALPPALCAGLQLVSDLEMWAEFEQGLAQLLFDPDASSGVAAIDTFIDEISIRFSTMTMDDGSNVSRNRRDDDDDDDDDDNMNNNQNNHNSNNARRTAPRPSSSSSSSASCCAAASSTLSDADMRTALQFIMSPANLVQFSSGGRGGGQVAAACFSSTKRWIADRLSQSLFCGTVALFAARLAWCCSLPTPSARDPALERSVVLATMRLCSGYHVVASLGAQCFVLSSSSSVSSATANDAAESASAASFPLSFSEENHQQQLQRGEDEQLDAAAGADHRGGAAGGGNTNISADVGHIVSCLQTLLAGSSLASSSSAAASVAGGAAASSAVLFSPSRNNNNNNNDDNNDNNNDNDDGNRELEDDMVETAVVSIAKRLLTAIAQHGGSTRSLSMWVSFWRAEFPIVSHFSAVLAATHHVGDARPGVTSMAFEQDLHCACAAIATFGHRHGIDAVAVWLVYLLSGTRAKLPDEDGDVAKTLARAHDVAAAPLEACRLYRAAMLMLYLNDSSSTTFLCEPGLVESLLCDVRQAHALSIAADAPQVDRLLSYLLVNCSLFLASVAVHRGDYFVALQHLDVVCDNDPQSTSAVEEHVTTIVHHVLESPAHQQQLVRAPIKHEYLLRAVNSAIFESILNPIDASSAVMASASNYGNNGNNNNTVNENNNTNTAPAASASSSSSSNHFDRDLARAQHTTFFVQFLVARGALGSAARVAHDVASSLRCSRCDLRRLRFAAQLLSLAICIARSIPDVDPPNIVDGVGTSGSRSSGGSSRGGGGAGDGGGFYGGAGNDLDGGTSFAAFGAGGGDGGGGGSMMYASRSMVFTPQGLARRPLSRRHVPELQRRLKWLSCEIKLAARAPVDRPRWNSSLTPLTNSESLVATTRELLHAGMWRDATELCDAFPGLLHVGSVFQVRVGDLLHNCRFSLRDAVEAVNDEYQQQQYQQYQQQQQQQQGGGGRGGEHDDAADALQRERTAYLLDQWHQLMADAVAHPTQSHTLVRSIVNQTLHHQNGDFAPAFVFDELRRSDPSTLLELCLNCHRSSDVIFTTAFDLILEYCGAAGGRRAAGYDGPAAGEVIFPVTLLERVVNGTGKLREQASGGDAALSTSLIGKATAAAERIGQYLRGGSGSVAAAPSSFSGAGFASSSSASASSRAPQQPPSTTTTFGGANTTFAGGGATSAPAAAPSFGGGGSAGVGAGGWGGAASAGGFGGGGGWGQS